MRSILKPLWTSHIIRTLTKSFGWETSMVITHVITTVINTHMSHLAACVPAAFHLKLVELLLTTTESEVFGLTAFSWKKAAAHLWASVTEEGRLRRSQNWTVWTSTHKPLSLWQGGLSTVILIGTMLLFHVDMKPPQTLLLWPPWHQHGSQIFKCF